MLAGLHALPADGVILDLEDGVAPGDKSSARDHVRRAAADGVLGRAPSWSLRVNPARTTWHEADLHLAEELQAPRIVLPKAEDPGTAAALARRCANWGGTVGLMIETARGVARVRELATCDPAIDLLVYGSADFRISMGARPDAAREWERHALAEILLAARVGDCQAIDAVYFHYRDADGLRREARTARDLGYDGKSCIHPGQVGTIHDVFAVTAEELAWAREVLEVWRARDGEREGIVGHRGEMLEALHARLAERILRRAERERAAGGQGDGAP